MQPEFEKFLTEDYNFILERAEAGFNKRKKNRGPGDGGDINSSEWLAQSLADSDIFDSHLLQYEQDVVGGSSPY